LLPLNSDKMRSKHIIVVDDVPELLSSLERRLQNVYGNNYEVYGFQNAQDALKHINNEIDANGNILTLVASDEKMSGMQGHELLEEVGRTHSNTKRILYSGYTDYNALRAALNKGVDEFVQKADPNERGEGLYKVIDAQLAEYEKQPRVEIALDKKELEQMSKDGMITKPEDVPSPLEYMIFKLADTKYEKQQFFGCRYGVYMRAGHITEDDLTAEQIKLKREWDKYDNLPTTRYVIVKIGGEIIGGARIVDGEIPMEKAQIVKVGEGGRLIEETGKKFILEDYLSALGDLKPHEYVKREISRLCIDEKYRKSSTIILAGIFRMIANMTRDQDFLWCAGGKSQIGLYGAIGFSLIRDGNEEPVVIKYDNLRPIWWPMVGSWKKATKATELALQGKDYQHLIEGFIPNFFVRATSPVKGQDPLEWMHFSKDIYQKYPGYVKALFAPNVSNTK
jgi:FixJ family two-component response regulator